MTPFIEEARHLLHIAERDYQTFDILRAHPDSPLASTCFHAQQCVEKAMKAVLAARQVFFRRTHDLEEIANLLTEAGLNRHSAWMNIAASALTRWKCVMTIKSFH